jgi:hypothetical protein
MEEPTPNYYPPNNRLLNNRLFIEQLYKGISAGLKRPLSNTEKKWLQDMLKQEIPLKFRNKSPNEILALYINSITTKFKQDSCTYDKIDIHELNKSQIGLVAEVSKEDFSYQAPQQFATNIVQPNVSPLTSIGPTIKTEYITLDSRYRSLDNDGTTFFRWNAVYDDSDIQGGFNINQRVRDVVAIKCFPIKLPYIGTADNDYGRVTLLFQEFQSQSFAGHENRKYHFVFATDVQDRWIHLRSHNYNDGVHKFAIPLTQISTLTVTFGSPLQPIIFDQDRMHITIATYGANTIFNSLSPHNLETGDLVYITNFITFNPPVNAPVIGQINNQNGNVITYIDDYNFYIDVNTTPVYNQGVGTITVTNGSNSVLGIGTSFISFYQIGDRILVNGNYLVIQSIISNTSIIATSVYTGVTGTYIYYIDNRIPNLQVPVYFGSKRIFMNFEISYIDRGTQHV